jgi:glycosyltransferase involved in cell wall biosynthesis
VKTFSIILPVYNGGELVKQCVNSILSQTCTEFNLLVLDNSSSDGTPEWIQALSDERVRIYSLEHTVSMEQNWGRIKDIEKNEFITLIGHDDILHPGYLEEMNQLIEKHPEASLYQAHYNYIDNKGNFLRSCLPMDEVQYGHEFLACQMTRTSDSMGTGYLMRSKDYDAITGMPTHYPNLIFADYQLWVQLSSISYKATSVKTLFDYRVHQNVSKTTNGENYIEAFKLYIGFLNTIKNKPGFHEVINRYGKDFLMYYCQALSHRLLKMPKHKRSLRVKEYIEMCTTYAQELIPQQSFAPLSRPLIKIAQQLDSNMFGRKLFQGYQKIKRK